MRSKDITLASSLIGIFVVIQVVGATSPIKISALMTSALFGLFWNYFSTRQNVSFQFLRLNFKLINALYRMPAMVGIIKNEAIAGMELMKLHNGTHPIDLAGYELMRIWENSVTALGLLKIYFGYALVHCLILPYLFYRYFKAVGIFKRLPSF